MVSLIVCDKKCGITAEFYNSFKKCGPNVNQYDSQNNFTPRRTIGSRKAGRRCSFEIFFWISNHFKSKNVLLSWYFHGPNLVRLTSQELSEVSQIWTDDKIVIYLSDIFDHESSSAEFTLSIIDLRTLQIMQQILSSTCISCTFKHYSHILCRTSTVKLILSEIRPSFVMQT